MKNITKKALFFKALGDDVRLRIVQHLLLKEKPRCICELSSIVQRDPSVVFRHIELLRTSGIIRTQKIEKSLMCSISDKVKIKRLLEN